MRGLGADRAVAHPMRYLPQRRRPLKLDSRESALQAVRACLKSSALSNPYFVHAPAKLWHHMPFAHIVALHIQLALTAPSAQAAICMCLWWCIAFACAAPADMQTASSTAANIFIVAPPLKLYQHRR